MRLLAALLSVGLTLAPALADGISLPGLPRIGLTDAAYSYPPASGGLSCSYTPVTTGTQGVAYTGATPSASGGTPSYTFSETGSLPTGLTISSSTGVLSGTPSVSGSFPSIQVKVTDSASTTVNCGGAFTLVISPSGGAASYTAVTAAGLDGAFTHNEIDTSSVSWGSGVGVCTVYDNLGNTDLVVTINGTGATQIGTYTDGGSLWRANISSGTGIAKAVTGGTFGGVAISCGVVTTTTTTPTGSQLAAMASSAEPQATVTGTVPSNGVAVVFGGGATFGANPSPCSWTGATRQAANETFVATGNGGAICGASTTTAGSTTPGVSTTGNVFNFAGTSGYMAIATWGP